MAGDDDIGAQLPRPPLPAPARREAAIETAMRRFDGEAPSAAPARKSSSPGAFAWLSGPGRPYAAALAGTFLVALVALPLAWKPMGDEGGRKGGDRPPATAKSDNPPEPSVPATAGLTPGATPGAPPTPGDDAQAIASPAEKAAPGAPEPEAMAEVVPPPPPPPMMAPPPPAPPPPPPPPPPPMESADEGRARQEARPFADNKAADAQSVTVTGARVRRPNLESAAPVTSVGAAEARDDQVVVTGSRIGSAAAARRGDWNACTVNDPARSLRGCAGLVDARARGAPGRAGSGMADGLALAWRGDLNGAINAFDQVIAATPRSSFAYLNRGQARLRNGDPDGALADLDRAVRYAPRTARAYYNRSLVLRQKGDLRRARADEARAVDLDERYAELVR